MNKTLVFLAAAGIGWFFLLRPKPAQAAPPLVLPRSPVAAPAPAWAVDPSWFLDRGGASSPPASGQPYLVDQSVY
jgi:hypothetical protein